MNYEVADDYIVGEEATERVIGVIFKDDTDVQSTGLVTFSSSDGLKLSHNVPFGLDGEGEASVTVKGPVITLRIGTAKVALNEAKLNKLNDFLNLITPTEE